MVEKWAPMTISVTSELRDRMQKHSEVNWSEVAREAFNRRIREMENAQNLKLSKETVARLVASRERAENEDRSLGYESGKRWAERDAEWSELRSLAAEFEEDDELALDRIYALYSKPPYELDHREIAEWLERELGDAPHSDDLIAGFIEGATAVYEAMTGA